MISEVNLGHALETVVMLELERSGAEIAYVRTSGGYEVDFHVHHVDGRQELIQVRAGFDQPDTLAREIRALEDAATDFPLARPMLIALDKPVHLALHSNITVVAARDWLLEKVKN